MTDNTINPLTSFYQIECLVHELKLIVNHQPIRWLTCWFSGSTQVIITYRLDRFGFLIFKKFWTVLRLLLLPAFIIARILGGNHEIHYMADVGKGLQVLHPGLGIVVSRWTTAGDALTLTGGNCIGIRQPISNGELVLGDHIFLGANAVILGPVHLGSNIQIGAGAVVITDAPDNVMLAGVPAKIVRYNQSPIFNHQ